MTMFDNQLADFLESTFTSQWGLAPAHSESNSPLGGIE